MNPINVTFLTDTKFIYKYQKKNVEIKLDHYVYTTINCPFIIELGYFRYIVDNTENNGSDMPLVTTPNLSVSIPKGTVIQICCNDKKIVLEKDTNFELYTKSRIQINDIIRLWIIDLENSRSDIFYDNVIDCHIVPIISDHWFYNFYFLSEEEENTDTYEEDSYLILDLSLINLK